jgi:hypothetical protein
MIENQNLIQNYFKENSYVVIKNYLNKDMSNMFYNYCKIKVSSIDFKIEHYTESYNRKWDGGFGEQQVASAYSSYGDVLMDTLLNLSTHNMKLYTNIDLIPTYSYWRLYEKGNDLKRHIDRKSCEISTTLCLGYDISNLKETNYNWPIFVKDKNSGQSKPIYLEPGDMLIYRGCELEHWREPFLGLNHAQVFLHYNENNEENIKNYLDGRPMFGIPKLT